MLSFQTLDVYQCAIRFLSLTRVVISKIPRGNADLVDQIRRSAQSIPLDIAEAVGRTSGADKARHFTIARGSAMECAAQLDVLQVEELVAKADFDEGMELLERISAMLTKLMGF